MADSIRDLWSRLEAQFEKKHPTLRASLNPPASEQAIEAFEAATQLTLPPDVRDSYLLHDGCKSMSDGGSNESDLPLLFSGFRWSSLAESLERWKFDAQFYLPEDKYFFDDQQQWEAVRPWCTIPPCWLPIGRYADDNFFQLFIDNDPGPRGTVGQMVSYMRGAAYCSGPGFSIYLHRLADALELDKIEFCVSPSKPRGEWRYIHDGSAFEPFREG
jgi:cell wall assembly regulator SMI1